MIQDRGWESVVICLTARMVALNATVKSAPWYFSTIVMGVLRAGRVVQAVFGLSYKVFRAV